MSKQSIVGKVGKFNVCFRDVTLSSHAGLALLDEFAQQLGVAQVMDEELQVKRRERGYRESEAVLSLSHNLIVGGSCLLDLNVLRGDVGTRQLVGQAQWMAPTTAGEFWRKFDIGDIHDLYRAHQRLQARVRPHQAATCCTLDVDSSVYPQASTHKQGSVKAYNGEVGYHPFFVFWTEARELVFSHLRRGSAYTSSKFAWCLKAALKRLPADLPKKLRADSGLYDQKVVALCETRITSPLGSPQIKLRRCWRPLRRFPKRSGKTWPVTTWRRWPNSAINRNDGRAPIATSSSANCGKTSSINCTSIITSFVTNDETSPADHLLEWHLQHADMENLIKEHKHGFSLEKLPTQNFHANWAYLLIGQLAFNLVAWFKTPDLAARLSPGNDQDHPPSRAQRRRQDCAYRSAVLPGHFR